MRFTIKVMPSRSGNIGKVQLNNLPALHALDLDMVRALNDIIPTYSSLKATMFTSSNSEDSTRKVFCAGGDVKSVYLAGMGLKNADGIVSDKDLNAKKQSQHGFGTKNLLTADFFREEYQLNHKIATQSPNTPQISIWDGIVMGGGVGISVHGKYRVATENSLLAMPETNIGLFPDVGGTYFLPRLQGGLGPYLALTGARLKADDLMYSGIATHYVPSERIDEMTDELVKKSMEEHDKEGDCAAAILMSYHENIGDDRNSFLAQNQEVIDETFHKKDTVEDIITALEKLGPENKFGKKTLDTLMRMSPTSLKVTLEGMKRGKEMGDITECLKMEYRVSQSFMKEGSDFYEGIRAALVDKDRNPSWNPSTLDGVTDEVIASHFESLGEYELVIEEDEATSFAETN